MLRGVSGHLDMTSKVDPENHVVLILVQATSYLAANRHCSTSEVNRGGECANAEVIFYLFFGQQLDKFNISSIKLVAVVGDLIVAVAPRGTILTANTLLREV